MAGMRTAVIAGASGLVGGHCLTALLGDDRYDRITTVGRREMAARGPRHRHVVIDFEDERTYGDVFGATDVFCCLGTTIRKAGSREAFRNVDRAYPRRIAQAAHDANARQYLIITARGANPRSPIFYNRVKGEVERDLASIAFYGTYIFRPTLLLGNRDERRRGEEVAEKVFRALDPLLRGPLGGLRPIDAESVARSMVEIAISEPGGFKAYEADEMRAIDAGARR